MQSRITSRQCELKVNDHMKSLKRGKSRVIKSRIGFSFASNLLIYISDDSSANKTIK